MTIKLTKQQFIKSTCNGCIWIRKVDDGHYLCPFGIKCMRESEEQYAKQIKKEK